MATEYFQVEVGVVAAGQFALNVFHYKVVDPTEPDEFVVATQLLAAFEAGGANAWLLKYAQVMSDQAFVSSLRARRVAPSGGNTAGTLFASTDWVGDFSSEINTQQIAACVIWVDDTTPGITGRNFIPGIPEDALLGSRWDATYQTVVDAFIAKHLAGHTITAGTALPSIYDRVAKSGKTPDNGYLSPLVGTQRRRELPV